MLILQNMWHNQINIGNGSEDPNSGELWQTNFNAEPNIPDLTGVETFVPTLMQLNDTTELDPTMNALYLN